MQLLDSMSKLYPLQPCKNLALERFIIPLATEVKCSFNSSLIGPKTVVLVISVVPS